MKARYSALSDKEKKMIGNGCGTLATAFFIPNFCFLASCDQHDFYFFRGGGLRNFFSANFGFYSAMLGDVSRQSAVWKMITFFILSSLYFLAVTIFGGFAFKWGEERTLEDIRSLINNNA